MTPSVEITRTTPVYPNGVFVQWALRGVAASGDYVAAVFRSGGPNGPWEAVGTALTDTYCIRDSFPLTVPDGTVGANQLSLARGIYYRVVVTLPSGSSVETVAQVEAYLDSRQRLLKRKLLRDESVMLRKLNGVDVAVLKRRHWGVRCPICFDSVTKEAIRANCTNCFGVTFVGGYFTPVITLAKRGLSPRQAGMTPQGKGEIATASVTLLDIPGVQDDDVLVFLRDNRRFKVNRVEPTELRTVAVHQRLTVSELPRTDIVYRIQVDPTHTPPLF